MGLHGPDGLLLRVNRIDSFIDASHQFSPAVRCELPAAFWLGKTK